MIIGLDAGHSLSGAGSSAIGIVKESDMNRKVLKRLTEMLKEKGHTVINCTCDYSPDGTSLGQRMAIVNKANSYNLDLFVSLHLNASNGQGHGVETYTCRGANSITKQYARDINNELVKHIGWRDRGIKEENWTVCVKTKARALLVELGFCDNKGDMDKWNTENICKALFKGITKQHYVSSTQSSNNTFYRVIADSYTVKQNAINRQNQLKSLGFDSFLIAKTINGKLFYRVVVGSYQDKKNAEVQQAKLKKHNINSFLEAFKK